MTNPDVIPVVPGLIIAALLWFGVIRLRCWR